MSGTVAMLLVDASRRVLLGRRSRFKASYADCWDAPGGHVEPGETLEQALVREMREELGIELRAWTPLGIIDFEEDGRTVPCRVYAGTAWDGVPHIACDEHEELRWVAPDGVAALPKLASPSYPAFARRAVLAADHGR